MYIQVKGKRKRLQREDSDGPFKGSKGDCSSDWWKR